MSSGVLVGLMSGTSLDGISAAVARFRDASDGRIDVELLAYTSRPYSSAERNRLSAALGGGTPAEYCRLNFDLGGWLADAAIQVMAEADLESARKLFERLEQAQPDQPLGRQLLGPLFVPR